jgi:Ni,Fe-hydrogenase III small subunit
MRWKLFSVSTSVALDVDRQSPYHAIKIEVRECVTPEFIDRKHQITQQPGVRFAHAAFVTGALDPATSRDLCLAWFQGLSIPVMVVIGEQAPPKSKTEMEVLAKRPGVLVKSLPSTLGMHEEYATEVAETILPFL